MFHRRSSRQYYSRTNNSYTALERSNQRETDPAMAADSAIESAESNSDPINSQVYENSNSNSCFAPSTTRRELFSDDEHFGDVRLKNFKIASNFKDIIFVSRTHVRCLSRPSLLHVRIALRSLVFELIVDILCLLLVCCSQLVSIENAICWSCEFPKIFYFFHV